MSNEEWAKIKANKECMMSTKILAIMIGAKNIVIEGGQGEIWF